MGIIGTKQVCLFRDSYEPFTAAGYSIFGLSNDSPKANTTFKTKQKLPYTLLCDPAQTLISAIGLKKAPKGTTRGVFVVDKSGKVLAAEPGGPDATCEVVKKLVGGNADGGLAAREINQKEDVEAAKTADEVANTAAKVDA
jgi:peroxiredoxin Q/BCP